MLVAEFSWLMFALVTFSYVMIDGLYTLWIYQVSAVQTWQSSLTAGAIALLHAIGVITYISNYLYIAGVVIGSCVGTYIVVRWKSLQNSKRKRKPTS